MCRVKNHSNAAITNYSILYGHELNNEENIRRTNGTSAFWSFFHDQLSDATEFYREVTKTV